MRSKPTFSEVQVLAAGLPPLRLVAKVPEAAALDQGHPCNAIRVSLAEDGIEPVIPPKSDRK